MGQSEVYYLLKKQTEPLAVGEIARLMNDNQKKISLHLAKMYKYNEVQCIEINRFEAMKRYKCKHRMRLWFIKKDGSS